MGKKRIAVFGAAGLIVIIFICVMSAPTITKIQTKDGKTISAKTMTFPDGRKYVGELKDGKANGYGILYEKDGSTVYEGEYLDGRPAAITEALNQTSDSSSTISNSSDTSANVTSENNPTITKAEFDQIKSGMTYEQVSKIIGGPGELLSESGSKGNQFYTVMYMYDGEGELGANANFMFQADKLQNKAQMGLK